MTRELKGLCILMLAYVLGVTISRLFGDFMPGSIIGMLILFILLQTKIVDEADIKNICNFVINNMMMLFVPVTAGLMVSYKALKGGWVGSIFGLIISTIIVLLVVGGVQQYLWRRWKR